MVILKKIKSSTLIETIVATVIIITVFMVSSLILNNLFSNVIANNIRPIEAEINKIHYLYNNGKVTLPYFDEINDWTISAKKYNEFNVSKIEFQAVNRKTKKVILKHYFESK